MPPRSVPPPERWRSCRSIPWWREPISFPALPPEDRSGGRRRQPVGPGSERSRTGGPAARDRVAAGNSPGVGGSRRPGSGAHRGSIRHGTRRRRHQTGTGTHRREQRRRVGPRGGARPSIRSADPRRSRDHGVRWAGRHGRGSSATGETTRPPSPLHDARCEPPRRRRRGARSVGACDAGYLGRPRGSVPPARRGERSAGRGGRRPTPVDALAFETPTYRPRNVVVALSTAAITNSCSRSRLLRFPPPREPIRRVGGRLTAIGRVTRGRGAWLRTGGRLRPMPPAGWRPFARRTRRPR